MEPKKYPLSVLERLCDGDIADRLPWHVLDDDGLWLKPRQCVSPSVERNVMEWHPQEDEEVAALPVPFTAAELAAFMLAGGGYFLLEPFEQLEDLKVDAEGRRLPSFPWPSLDEESLQALGPNAGRAREALREAHRLLCLCAERFGRDDAGVRSSAAWLLNGADSHGKKWGEDRLRALKEYRAQYGTKAAAKHFQISEARVRHLLPGLPEVPTAHAPFQSRKVVTKRS